MRRLAARATRCAAAALPTPRSTAAGGCGCGCGCGCAASAAAAAPVVSVRHCAGFATNMSASALGRLTPWQGFVSDDIEAREIKLGEQHGGSLNRGMFARRDLRYDRELMRVPALAYWVGDEPVKEQCLEVTKSVLAMAVAEGELPRGERPFQAYLGRRLQTLMTGGRIVFRTEAEVERFLADVPGNGMSLVEYGVLSTFEVSRLAQQVEYNRFEVDYNGRKGVALFPEASTFNHHCEPNIELGFHMTLNREYVLTARVLKPVRKGEELFIHYYPGNDLPLSRFNRLTRERWGFECQCPVCKQRALNAVVFILIVCVMPIVLPLRSWLIGRQQNKARTAGVL